MIIKVSDFRYKMICIIIQLLILAVENAVLNNIATDFNLWTRYACAATLVNIVFQILALVKGKRLFTLGGAMIILCYVFQCSFVVLMGLNLIPVGSTIYTLTLPKIGNINYAEGVNLEINCIAALFIGFILVSNEKNNQLIRHESEVDVSNFYGCGIPMAIVFGFFYFYSIITWTYNGISTGNYLTAISSSREGMWQLGMDLIPFFIGAIYLLLVYYKHTNRMKICKRLFIVLIGSLMFSLLSGHRGFGMSAIVLILLFWVNDISKINFKKAIAYVIAGLFLLQLLISIRYVRNYGLSFINILNAFLSPTNNLFYEVLSEFGITSVITGGYIGAGIQPHPLDFFIRELGSILPNISSWGGEIFLVAKNRVNLISLSGYGSSLISDLYFYFGVFAPFIMAFIGCWVGFIENKINKWRAEGKYYYIAMAIPGISSILGSVRSPVTLGLKMFVYSFIIFTIFRLLFSRIREHPKKR